MSGLIREFFACDSCGQTDMVISARGGARRPRCLDCGGRMRRTSDPEARCKVAPERPEEKGAP